MWQKMRKMEIQTQELLERSIEEAEKRAALKVEQQVAARIDAAMMTLEVRECPNISGISGSESTCLTKFVIDHDLYEKNLKQKSEKVSEKNLKSSFEHCVSHIIMFFSHFLAFCGR